jgi:hypothetical protein
MPSPRRPPLRLVLPALAALAACRADPPPGAPVAGPDGPLPPAHGAGLPWPAGRWSWRWSAAGSGGPAELLVAADARGGTWSWRFPAGQPPAAADLAVEPVDTTAWLPLRLPAAAPPEAWLPLPRLPVASAAYPHLVALLADLTGPRFGGRVTHWPGRPVPVRIPPARSGAVDLASCLRTALGRWNEGEAAPWFVPCDTAAWGVRLVHLPGRHLVPPLQAQITRLDSLGRPLRIHIIAGDNYDDPWDSVYAERGMVHELGHALFLWGHSRDRGHVLWGAAPPLEGWPSPDERKAALLWHGLPEGCALDGYGALIPP